MGPVDVRRLAAIDMYGSNGSPLRRTIIVIEFILGAVAGTAIGLFVLFASDSLGWQVFGAFVTGACLNYVPLTLHALSLLRRGALAEELRGVDIRSELHRYTVLQVWLVVPLLFLVLAAVQARGQRPARRRSATSGPSA